MDKILHLLKTEPVRVYETAAALLALLALYVQDVPVAGILAVLVPILGLGEVARSQVTPTEHVLVDTRELDPLPYETAEDL